MDEAATLTAEENGFEAEDLELLDLEEEEVDDFAEAEAAFEGDITR